MKGALVCYFYASFYYYVIYFHFKTLSYVFSLVLPTIFLCKILSKHLKAKSTVPFCPGFQFLLLDIQLFNLSDAFLHIYSVIKKRYPKYRAS